ncbi:MAG: protein phosphatase CheZ [Alphaproteobacteria bacterium]
MERNKQVDALRAEIGKLYDYLQKIKLEIASIKHPRSQIDQFGKVADQLATIVAATEDATNTIMEASETINAVVAELDEMVRYPEATAQHQRIIDAINRIFEACSFQDITGQRISKIIKTMNLIEGTVNSLIVIVGSDSVAVPLPMIAAADEPLKNDNGIGLYGPSSGVSQEDIDKLFG